MKDPHLVRVLPALVVAWLVVCSSGCRDGDKSRGASISGVVTKADGTPVPGAAVTLDGYGVSCVVDEGGRYSLGPLPPGRYTLVAAFPSFRSSTRADLELAAKQRLTGVDFQLTEDPDYVPDSIEIDKTKPAVGTTLQAGELMRFEITARYNLANHTYAKVKFYVQDEKEQSLTRFPKEYTVGAGEDVVAAVLAVRLPKRDDAKVFIAAALIPGGQGGQPVIDYVSFDVQRPRDDVTLPRVELQTPDEKEPLKLTVVADVGYTLDALEKGRLVVTIRVAYRDQPTVDLAKEVSQPVDKATMASGTHVFVVPIRVAPNTGSVIVRAELLPVGGGVPVDRAAHAPVPVPWGLPDEAIVPGAEPKAEKPKAEEG